VTVAVLLNNFSAHALLDTESAVSIINLGTVRRMGVENSVLRPSEVSLLNLSREKMKILVSVVTEFQLMGSQV